MFESAQNLLNAPFAAESGGMTGDASAFKRPSFFWNPGIAANTEEWHHIFLEAEIFAWPSHPLAGFLADSTKFNACMEDATA